MIKLLLKYPIRTRKIILIALAMLLSYFIYSSTIKNTISAYSKVQAYNTIADPNSEQQQELFALKQKLNKLDDNISKQKREYVTNAELLITTEEQIVNLNCKVYALPKLIEDRSEVFNYGISEIILEGNFKSLVQGLDLIDQSYLGKHLVSSKFSISKNWSTQSQELLLHLIFKQIKNEE
jgi:hypothetical protein